MDELERLERQRYAIRERERTAEAARQEREALRRRLLVAPVFEPEDPVAKWKREADALQASVEAETRRRREEEAADRRARLNPELALQLQAFDEIAGALETLDSRLHRVERQRKPEKAARKSRLIGSAASNGGRSR
jgi:hypothetical protein